MRLNLPRITATGHPLAPKLHAAAEACISIAETFAKRKAAIDSDNKLTTEGKRDAIRKALPGVAVELQRARTDITRAKRDVEMRSKALVMPQRDPGDAAGAIRDWEIRDYVRSLDPGARIAFLKTTDDVRVLEAALSAPPQMVGIVGPNMETVADAIEANYIKVKYGREAAEIEALEAVVSEADAIAKAARVQLRGDLDEKSFTALVGPAEKFGAAPWLVGDKSRPETAQVCVPNPETGLAEYHPASEWEAKLGVFYANADEWRAANADPAE